MTVTVEAPSPPTSRLRRTLRTFRLFGTLFTTSLRAETQYRANLTIAMVGAIAHQTAGFAFIWVVLDRFGVIGGWTLPEVAFLYGMRLTAHGIFTFFGSQIISSTDDIVREGDYDRYLVRPLNPLLQVMTRRIDLTVSGDIAGGVALLAVATFWVDVAWTPLAVGYLLLAVLGGAMVEGALQVFVAALTFRLLSTDSFRFAVDGILTTFGGYPLKIFPTAARFGLTFVIPLAFMAYFPATVLLDRTDELSVVPAVAYLAPAVGAALLAGAYRFWRRQSTHYKSSGH